MNQPYDPDPERVIGVWRRSMTSPGFWVRVLLTLTLYYWLFWERNKIMLTNRRITQFKPLIVGGSEISLAIENITEVNIHTPPLGALLGFADVKIQTPGGNQAAEIDFRAVARPAELKAAVFEQQDRRRRRGWRPATEG